MICPFCNDDNIDGVDQCACCQADLSGFDDAEGSSGIERDLLQRRLGDILTHDVISVPPDLPVGDAVRRLNQGGHHCAVVTEGDRITGIFTERDVLTKLADKFEERSGDPVSKYMTENPVTLQFDDTVVFGLNRMMVGGYRHIPIQRGDKLAGVVSVRDILGYMADHFGEWLPAENAH